MKEKLLPLEIMESYDYFKIRKTLFEVFSLFKYFKTIDTNVPLPIITMDYRVRYEQFVRSIKSSKVENYVVQKILQETRKDDFKRKELLTKITMSLRTLSAEELQIFKMSFYNKISDEDISTEINYCVRVVQYAKKSAYIRFLIALGLDDKCFKGGGA